MGFEVLCNGHKALINCTRDLLLKEGITLQPAEQTVVEVLETVAADDLVIGTCDRLRAAGYLIALDDFVTNDPRASMAGSVDFIKVDFERTTPWRFWASGRYGAGSGWWRWFARANGRPQTWCSRLWCERTSVNNSRGKFRVRNRTFFWSAWYR
jgi:hypothetical protein